MAKSKSRKINSGGTGDLEVFIFWGGVVFAALFLISMVTIMQTLVRAGILDAPNVIAGGLAAVLALYSFANASRLRYKYGAVVVLSMLATAMLFYVFGLSSAGNILFRL